MKPRAIYSDETHAAVCLTDCRDGIPGKQLMLGYDKTTRLAMMWVEYHGEILHVDHMPLKTLEQAITLLRQS